MRHAGDIVGTLEVISSGDTVFEVDLLFEGKRMNPVL